MGSPPPFISESLMQNRKYRVLAGVGQSLEDVQAKYDLFINALESLREFFREKMALDVDLPTRPGWVEDTPRPKRAVRPLKITLRAKKGGTRRRRTQRKRRK